MKFPSIEIDKRDRDEHTDTLIKSLLDEEKASKKQRRGSPQADVGAKSAVPARKGKTFAEIEAEEGGPIKESLVGMAHTKRALDRKKRDLEVGDTDVVTNTERYEEDTLEVEQEDGITFEPFNLKQEREEGYFDEDGNYVLRKQGGEEGDDEKDAWLNSEEAKVVSDEVRRRIENQRARAEEAARRGPLTERQIAQRKADMAAMMRPGETITRALKRLGGSGGAAAAGLTHRAMGKRERARLLAQQQQQQQQGADDAGGSSAAKDAKAAAARQQFVHMTELADELLEEGELEIYDATQEDLLRSARIWLPQLAGAPLPPPSSSMSLLAGGGTSASAATKHANDTGDEDEDMFADDAEDGGDGGRKDMAPGKGAAAAAAVAAVDQDQDMFSDGDEGEDTNCGGGRREDAPAATDSGNRDGVTEPGEPGGQAIATAASSVAAAAAQSSEGDTVDYASWPIKELKRILQERGVDPSGFVEKGDLVSKIKEVVDGVGPAGAGAGGIGSGNVSAFVAPAGYVFDPSSGYFYSEESGMYYDINTGGYCQAASGQWFYLDPLSGTFLEWKQ
ncbi:hypothetical protein VaNZ11_015992 [Volvox africanus]|uniref:OCRE domain-containing protein n=1 Tax=Volvox africanus TaxID=51714 RepID=A0ABQ5SN68_9CHLO|nr:hypothetical protein VaNZ11_015992 [Volvox africanus]